MESSQELECNSVERESLGALVREGHPPYIGQGEEEASATFMQGEGEVEELIWARG